MKLSWKIFTKPPKPLSPAKLPSTPGELDYSKAEQTWDERDGLIRVQNFNLRRLCWGLILICLTLTGGLVFQSTKASVAPYIIEVDNATGAVRNVGLVQTQEYKPTQATIKYFLGDVIKNVRGMPLDPVVFAQNSQKAYSYLTRGAAAKMTPFMEQQTAFLGKKTVQVSITVIVPMGENSYQVRWNEEEYALDSAQKTIVPMTGVFTVHLSPPKEEKDISNNPLGMYITDFNWSKDSSGK